MLLWRLCLCGGYAEVCRGHAHPALEACISWVRGAQRGILAYAECMQKYVCCVRETASERDRKLRASMEGISFEDGEGGGMHVFWI
jgi:hypothetical protein